MTWTSRECASNLNIHHQAPLHSALLIAIMAGCGRPVKASAKKAGGLSEFTTTESKWGKRRSTVTPIDNPAKRHQSAPPAQRRTAKDASASVPPTQGDLNTWDTDHYIQAQERLGPDAVLREYTERRPAILQAVLEARGPCLASGCGHFLPQDQHFRCVACLGGPLYCRECLVSTHQLQPFHTVEVWTGTHYSRTSLHDHGYIMDLRLGCISCAVQLPVTSTPPVAMTIVSSNGIHSFAVQPCACTDRDLVAQLMSLRMFPSTFIRPRTAFTFEVLDYFLIDYTTCKTTPHAFYKKLRRLSDPVDPARLPVSNIGPFFVHKLMI